MSHQLPDNPEGLKRLMAAIDAIDAGGLDAVCEDRPEPGVVDEVRGLIVDDVEGAIDTNPREDDVGFDSDLESFDNCRSRVSISQAAFAEFAEFMDLHCSTQLSFERSKIRGEV